MLLQYIDALSYIIINKVNIYYPNIYNLIYTFTKSYLSFLP